VTIRLASWEFLAWCFLVGFIVGLVAVPWLR
jgi:hypothetical protein